MNTLLCILLVLLQAVAPAKIAIADAEETATNAGKNRSPTTKPNFVFILGEGHGWSSTSVDMDGKYPPSDRVGLTPNLEQLANDGMRFSDFYATCPRCTPSRASFLTGISPAKLHMTYVNEGGVGKREQDGGKGVGEKNAGTDAEAQKYPLMKLIAPTPDMELPDGVKTTGDVMRAAGYATAHFGKWHAGRVDPMKHGFDISDGANTNQGPDRGEAPNPKQSSMITDRGIAFMREQVKAGKPFFLQMSHYGCGSEAEATPESFAETAQLLPKLTGKSLASAAGVRDMDKAVGRVRAALKELGISDNTYIYFSTDHGTPGGGTGRGVGANAPLTGSKGSVSEGGIRVPFIISGPGIQAGAISSVRASGMDVLPTMIDLAGSPLAKSFTPDAKLVVEGGSLKPVLKNSGAGNVSRPNDAIVIHFPHYDLNNGGPASAIFDGDLKLIRHYDTGKVTLFDIVKDPSESKDLSAEMPEKVNSLQARLDAYLKAVDAQMPTTAPTTTDATATGDGQPPTNPPASNGTQGDKKQKKGGGKGGKNNKNETTASVAQNANGGKGGKGNNGANDVSGSASGSEKGPPGSLIARMTAFHTEVPAHEFDIVLMRPTETSITATVSVAAAAEAFIEYWRNGESTKQKTKPIQITPSKVALIELSGLKANTQYSYQLFLKNQSDAAAKPTEEHSFRTRASNGTPFTFTIQADSHLDANMDPKVYEQALCNALTEHPDFHIDLGDTFMTDKRRDFHDAAPQYDAQRYYFGKLCHSAPLFMVLGNHDGEIGSSDTQSDAMGPWSYNMRTQRFPAIINENKADAMYSGRTDMKNGRGANYYAFEWGDALFVVLDPFWQSIEKMRGSGGGGGGGGDKSKKNLEPNDDSWSRTLGKAQYDWLANTLGKSKAKYKFVFIHHLVGGLGGSESRGGVESAPFFEWGGKNADGSEGFAAHRPGWSMPIHNLLVKNGVTAVFHGHDHLYVQSALDGVVYQCVPQPGNAQGGTRSAEEYGYKSGTILGSPGHIQVKVAPDKATVDFVRAAIAQQSSSKNKEENGLIVKTYDMKPGVQK